MQYLRPQDLQFVVRRLPRDVREQMERYPLFIGGGYIRETIAGVKPNDIDIFGPSADVLGMAAELLAQKRGGRSHKTDNACTVLAPPRVPVQYITRWMYGDAEAVCQSFDFTVCQAVVYRKAGLWCSVIADDFYADLAARRLVYTQPQREEAAGGSMLRVRKFLARGYNIQAQSLAGVIARVAGGVEDFARLSEAQRAFAITGLLHEVDPLLVIDDIEPVNDHTDV